MQHGEDLEVTVRTSARELAVYCVFLTILVIGKRAIQFYNILSSLRDRRCSEKNYYFEYNLVSLVTWSASSEAMYLHTSSIKCLFKHVSKVHSIDDFWKFMEHDFLDGVYPEEWYNTGLSDSLLCPDSTKQNGEYMCMCLFLCIYVYMYHKYSYTQLSFT